MNHKTLLHMGIPDLISAEMWVDGSQNIIASGHTRFNLSRDEGRWITNHCTRAYLIHKASITAEMRVDGSQNIIGHGHT